jgi:antitoxin VapB
MGIFIKNPEVERKARELAALKGKSLTAVIEEGLDRQLAEQTQQPKPSARRPTVEEMIEATERFRRKIGLDKVKVEPMTKRDWDALWPTGIPEIDDA